MLKNIVKIKKEGAEYLIFTSKGMLISLNKEEFELFNKYGKKKEIKEEYKDFLSKLAYFGVLEFKNFKPKEQTKTYDLSLKDHNSSSPLYPSPILAHLAITNKCNMACKYCSVRNIHKKIKQEELTTEQWKNIIGKLADWGVFQIGFTGGEPTLRKDIIELARFVSKKGCVFNMTTNGWLLDEKLVDKLVKAGMKQCQVSLDSHIPEIHDNLRGNNSYERVIKAINLLKKKKVAVGIDCVVSKNNLSSIPEFIEWIAKEKIPYLTLIKIKKGDLSYEDFVKLSPDYKEYSDLIKQICLREKNENPNITLDCGSVSNIQAVTKKENFSNIPIAGCPIGHHLICISPNGEIYACAALLEKNLCLGNILSGDIIKIWNKNILLKKLRLIKSTIKGKCRTCERLDFCRGGCRGIANSISKSLFVSDPTCKFLQEVKR